MPREFPSYGVGPDVWGPYFWTTMHIVSLGAPTAPTHAEQDGIRSFYESLQVAIPCPICREHYKHALAAMPPRVTSRSDLIEWVYDVHNYINQQLGKPVLPWDGFVAHMQRLGPPSFMGSPMSPLPLLLLGIGIGALGTMGVRRLFLP